MAAASTHCAALLRHSASAAAFSAASFDLKNKGLHRVGFLAFVCFLRLVEVVRSVNLAVSLEEALGLVEAVELVPAIPCNVGAQVAGDHGLVANMGHVGLRAQVDLMN